MYSMYIVRGPLSYSFHMGLDSHYLTTNKDGFYGVSGFPWEVREPTASPQGVITLYVRPEHTAVSEAKMYAQSLRYPSL